MIVYTELSQESPLATVDVFLTKAGISAIDLSLRLIILKEPHNDDNNVVPIKVVFYAKEKRRRPKLRAKTTMEGNISGGVAGSLS